MGCESYPLVMVWMIGRGAELDLGISAMGLSLFIINKEPLLESSDAAREGPLGVRGCQRAGGD
jgi:hypothetical protein